MNHLSDHLLEKNRLWPCSALILPPHLHNLRKLRELTFCQSSTATCLLLLRWLAPFLGGSLLGGLGRGHLCGTSRRTRCSWGCSACWWGSGCYARGIVSCGLVPWKIRHWHHH